MGYPNKQGLGRRCLSVPFSWQVGKGTCGVVFHHTPVQVQKQKQRTEAFVTIVDKYRQKLATGSHGKWTSEQ